MQSLKKALLIGINNYPILSQKRHCNCNKNAQFFSVKFFTLSAKSRAKEKFFN